LSSRGHPALGVDSAPLAIEKARSKAKSRGSEAKFMVADALDLERVGREFDTAVDCGLFHIFSDGERVRYERSLRRALRGDGRYFMLCFSDDEPASWGGPRRVSKEEILDTFREGWKVDFIRHARFETLMHDAGGKAWLTGLRRGA
jgi:SAM-dependent methyltransferase